MLMHCWRFVCNLPTHDHSERRCWTPSRALPSPRHYFRWGVVQSMSRVWLTLGGIHTWLSNFLECHPHQFVYAVLIGSFPFNAFLAGFFCCIGAFVLSGGLLRTGMRRLC